LSHRVKRREELSLISVKVVVKAEREEMRVLKAHDEGVPCSNSINFVQGSCGNFNSESFYEL